MLDGVCLHERSDKNKTSNLVQKNALVDPPGVAQSKHGLRAQDPPVPWDYDTYAMAVKNGNQGVAADLRTRPAVP
jgi:hypothetical protein